MQNTTELCNHISKIMADLSDNASDVTLKTAEVQARLSDTLLKAKISEITYDKHLGKRRKNPFFEIKRTEQ